MKNPGFTIVPVRLFYQRKGLAKLVVALAKGKKEYDKRESIKKKTTVEIWLVCLKDDDRVMKKTISQIVSSRILILDGAMGTMIQQYNLTEDFRGERFCAYSRTVERK